MVWCFYYGLRFKDRVNKLKETIKVGVKSEKNICRQGRWDRTEKQKHGGFKRVGVNMSKCERNVREVRMDKA